jgi:hypothetical protein
MSSILVRAVLLATLVSGLPGCATRHFTEMMLYRCDDHWDNCNPPKDQFDIFRSNNPIFVHDKAKMSLELASVNPGWIHQDRKAATRKGGSARRTWARSDRSCA